MPAMIAVKIVFMYSSLFPGAKLAEENGKISTNVETTKF